MAAPERDASEWSDALLRDIRDPEGHLVVADAGGTIVGYGRARLFEPAPDAPADTAPRGYYLTGIFVHPEQRRRGLGEILDQSPSRLDRREGRRGVVLRKRTK